ncbi:MAG: DegT/DnrJ/EryC1/StrS family aminotransferase, partial [Alphaproteobacteria bacterium]
ILTDDDDLARRARYLAAQAKDDPIEFVHGDIGFNYRLPNLNAAVALAQAEKLEEFLRRKRSHIDRYGARLEGIDGVAMWREAPWAESSYWMAMLTVDERKHPDAIARLRQFLPLRGIEARPAWLPLHKQAPFAGAPRQEIKVADRIYRTSLCLPCSTGLAESDLARTAEAIVDFFAMNT